VLGQNECQGARGEGIQEMLRDRGDAGRHLPNLVPASEVDDQRVVGRTALSLKDEPHGVRLEGVRPEPVDRFGGKGDQLAAAKAIGRLRGRSRACGCHRKNQQRVRDDCPGGHYRCG
jgi:hypothetical protein